MAAVQIVKNAKIIGTVEQIHEVLERLLRGGVVVLETPTIIVLAEPVKATSITT